MAGLGLWVKNANIVPSYFLMAVDCSFELQGESLRLLPQRAIYWPARDALLLADLHLGKAGHFRRNGVAVSGLVMQQDLAQLQALLAQWTPSQVIFLGDLFHSQYNREWEAFVALMEAYPGQARLVRGNHDILRQEHYRAANLELIAGHLDLGPFRLIHAVPTELPPGTPYYLAGHVHPGVQLLGAGRQRLRLPCFYFGSRHGLLPAFGQFTGLYCLEPRESDRVFAVVEDQVLPVSG